MEDVYWCNVLYFELFGFTPTILGKPKKNFYFHFVLDL